MGRVALRVQPGAAKQRVVGRIGEAWKVAVAAPPVDGKANDACIRLLAEICGSARSQITLLHGASSRSKLFEIKGMDDDAIDRRLSDATN
ncbi:MAG: DUF167 domain-containing protein [Acidobacteria bacterium]|nr:DUF167 domain-containing protein [Acidobacteriota bacterium]